MLSAFIKRLMFTRQFDISDGKIEVLGLSNVMLSYNLVDTLISSKQHELYDNLKNKTVEMVKFYSQKIGLESIGLIKALQEIFETYGLGKMQIVELDNKKKRGLIRVANVADDQKINEHIATNITAPILCGMFSVAFKKEVACKVNAAGQYHEFVIDKEGGK